MDDNDIEFMTGDIVEQFSEDRTPSNGIDVGGLTFLTVNADRFPTPVLTKFIKKSLLGIQRMPFYLGWV
jgi:hypothetical protein